MIVPAWQVSNTAHTNAPRLRIAAIAAPSSSSTIAFCTDPAAPDHLPMSRGRKISSSPSGSGFCGPISRAGCCEPCPAKKRNTKSPRAAFFASAASSPMIAARVGSPGARDAVGERADVLRRKASLQQDGAHQRDVVRRPVKLKALRKRRIRRDADEQRMLPRGLRRMRKKDEQRGERRRKRPPAFACAAGR
ncbi:MAG: hypothetical protein RML56_08780 [Burkholderiales bacterium]|nr:hypothetical protein [Burkholderiales bacterium]